MHPLLARQTPGDPVPSESPSEPGPGSTGETSVSAPGPSSSETQPPASESTPPSSESTSEPPPPPSSTSEAPSALPSSTLEQPSTTPTSTPPSETPTPSPTPTTQQSETLTTPTSPSSTESTESAASLTTVTTTVNGLPTTYVTPVPTSRLTANGGSDSRTGLIAGLTAGLIALLVVILTAVFLYRRHRLRRQMEVQTAEKKRKEGRSLLDGEGFEDDDHESGELGSRRGFVAMRSYNNVNQQPRSSPLGSHTPYGQRSPSPNLSILRSRASESGSIFREDVWPPPTEGLVDPIMKESSQVDLSRVVDEVMGPSSAQPHSRQGTHTSVDSMSPLIMNHDYDTTHSRGPSVDSQYMDPFQSTSPSSSSFARPQSTFYPSLAGAAALASFSSSTSAGAASTSTSQPQISQVVPPPPATMSTASTSLHRQPPSPIAFVASPTSTTPFSGSYIPTPPGAVAVLPASSSSQQRSTPPISISPISTKNANRSSVPKKSSPLARRLSQDALTWLSRGGPPGTGSQSKHS